jgi:hypothetical protein
MDYAERLMFGLSHHVRHHRHLHHGLRPAELRVI